MLADLHFKSVLLIVSIFQNISLQVRCQRTSESTSDKFKVLQDFDFEGQKLVRFGTLMHNDKYVSNNFEVVKVEGTYTLNSIVSDLSELLESRRKTVSKLAKVATRFPQQGSTESDANKNPELNQVIYSHNFKKEVNFNNSYVQVPYSVLPQNLKNLSWSKNFESEFKKNYERDKSLKWQYFGSTEGYIRIYPSFQWTKQWADETPNMYDCRKEIWYTRAVSCPHRNVILLDNSGSMKGMNKALAISVVSSILQVLTDSDFFTILAFSTEPINVVEQFKGRLVRAIEPHKQMVLENLDGIDTRNISDFHKAIEEAYDLLNIFATNNTNTSCNSAITIITDGLSTDLKSHVKQLYKKYLLEVRVFTYLIGRQKTDDKFLRELACEYNGYYKQIESKNNVQNNVMQYTQVFNRPLSKSQFTERFIWTKAYYQTSFDNKEIGMVATVSQPVYVKDKYGVNQLMGVVGCDVTIDEIIRAMKLNRLSVNSFVFMVTDEGILVTHPMLNKDIFETFDYSSQTVKSGYNSIDMNLLEFGQDTRRAMMQRETGSKQLKNFPLPVVDRQRTIWVNGTIFYQPVPNSSFSLGIFLPDNYGTLKLEYKKEFVDKQYSPEYNEENCKKVKHSQASNSRHRAICNMIQNDTNNGNLIAEQWNYCKMSSSKTHSLTKNSFFTNEDLLKNKFRSNNPNHYICDNELINKVLFDYEETWVYEKQWENQFKKNAESLNNHGVEMAFIATSSGLFRKYWSKQATDEYDETDCVVQKENFLKFKFDQFPDYYRRLASVGNPETRLYTFVNKGSCKEASILSAKLVMANGYIAAVAGYLRNYSSFQHEVEKKFKAVKEKNEIIKYCSQESVVDVECFAVDENGFVIYSNRENAQKTNIAYTHYEVMMALEENNFFIKTEIINKNDVCDKVVKENTNSSASSLITNKNNQKFFTMLLTASGVYFCSKKGTWNSMSLIVTIVWIICSNAVTTYFSEQTEPCIKKYDVFTANKSNNFSCGKVKSDNEFKYFYSSSINRSNLIIIIVSKNNYFSYNDCGEIKLNYNYTHKLENPRKINISSSDDDICNLFGSCRETKRERENSKCFSLSFKDNEDDYYCDDDLNTRNCTTGFYACSMLYYMLVLIMLLYSTI